MWADIRLKMYGAKTQQTTFIVEMIGVAADYAALEDEADLLASTGPNAEFHRDQVYGYWQDSLKTLVTNPIVAKQNPHSGRKPYYVLKRWSYTIKPSLTIDSDASPNSVAAKLFINDGKVINHAWVGTSSAYDATNVSLTDGVDDRLLNANYWGRNAGGLFNVAENPPPFLRRYLVIRAVNPTRIAAASETNDDTPSFDLVYRKCERVGTGA